VPSILTGDAYKVTTATRVSKLTTLLNSRAGPRRKSWRVILYCPDGGDPDPTYPGGVIPANTATVYAGPDGKAAFPIRPGAQVTFTNVYPWDIAMISATAAQLVFIAWGGEGPDEG
jgi:hypothetical protein